MILNSRTEYAVDGDGYVTERRHEADAREIVGRNPAKRRLLTRTALSGEGEWRGVDEQQDVLTVYVLRARLIFGDWVQAGVYLSLDGATDAADDLHRLFGHPDATVPVDWTETAREGDVHWDYMRNDGRFTISRSGVRP